MTKSIIAYTRVSTRKQGGQGVSISEQRRAITQYAEQHQLQIQDWLEERSTASKSGLPVFQTVMKCLRSSRGRTGAIIWSQLEQGGLLEAMQLIKQTQNSE